MIDLSHMLVYSIITDCPTNCLKCEKDGTDIKCKINECKDGTYRNAAKICEGE